MNLFFLIVGASCIGWVLPELVFLLSPNAENFRKVPVGINLFCMLGSVFMVCGLAA